MLCAFPNIELINSCIIDRKVNFHMDPIFHWFLSLKKIFFSNSLSLSSGIVTQSCHIESSYPKTILIIEARDVGELQKPALAGYVS